MEKKDEMNNCEQIDINDKKSYYFANLIHKRTNPGAIIIDLSQKIYVFGGHTTKQWSTTIERNDICNPLS